MANPVERFATCLNCGKRLRWDRERLTEAQQIENKAVDDYNTSLERSQYNLRKQRPHQSPSSYNRWTHATEQPGENKVACEIEGNGASRYNWRSKALPVEFCTSEINSYGYGDHTCNARSKDKKEWEPFSQVPLCGRHLAPKKKEARDAEQRKEKYELQDWIRTEVTKVCDLLETNYGLEANLHYDYGNRQYTGRIVVDPKKLLDLLKEEVL